MVSINKLFRLPRTHEGAKAIRFTPEKELKRTLMNCLLWEDQFYEDGVPSLSASQSWCRRSSRRSSPRSRSRRVRR